MKSKTLWTLVASIALLSTLVVGLFLERHLTKEPAIKMHFKIGVADPDKTQFLLSKAGAYFLVINEY